MVEKESRTEFLKIVLIPLILSVLGLLELYSISENLFWRQLLWTAIAIGVAFWVYRIPSELLKTIAVALYVLSIIGLIVVLGIPQAGPKRWLRLGGFNFQPSEFAKFTLILFLARLFDTKRPDRQFFKSVAASFIPFALVLIEPDLGTAGTFGLIFIGMAYLAGLDSRPIVVAIVGLLSAIASFSTTYFLILLLGIALISWIFRYRLSFAVFLFLLSIIVGLTTPIIWKKGLHEYQRRRILAFLEPRKYRKDIGWQSVQARIALGSGGFLGKGFRKGTQKGLAFLPAAHTDFIFSSIGEEFGFAATFLIILSFFIWINIVLTTSHKFKGRFRRILGYGISLHIAFHALINIASNIGFFPVVGLPLPFVTYGGSHLIVEWAMIAVFLRLLREELE